ncbi:MAG: helix-turn-helix transcriptional regulator, partial [Firmicutes bacterium]|nr:helix-turn-helix transcriptional regulator [Bacillota bacterium]
MSTLGERIKQVRKELAMTQEQLAGTDFTKGFISQVELNRINPSLKSLQLLAARLDRPVNFFLDDRDSRRLKEIDLLNST